MKDYKVILFATILLAFAGCGQNNQENVAAKKVTSAQTKIPTQQFQSDEILIMANKKVIDRKMTELGHAYELTVVDAEDNLYKLTVQHDDDQKLLKTIALLDSDSEVVFAEPNYKIQLKNTPKDELWLQQWALNNVGQDSPSGSQGEKSADIEALKAWQKSRGSKKVIVGVIDTGIDYTHPDLKGNMWINEAEKNGIPGKDDDGNGWTDDVYGWNFITANRKKAYYNQLGHPDPMDDNGHGSHCAGVIGATPDNINGIAGVNWQVSLMALKFLDSNGSGTSDDAYNAIKFAIANKVDILSNSWGGGSPSKTMLNAIRKASDAGILFVAAAGNDGSNNDYTPSFPANYPVSNVLSVAASDNKDQLASFSNYGQTVHLAAPGVDIISTIPLSKVSKVKKAYASYSGTSMATPYVAGAAALLLAHDPSLKGKPLEIKKRLTSTVDVVPQLIGRVSSRGRLNLNRALENQVNEEVANGEFSTEQLEIQSPMYTQERVDHSYVIHKKGASRIRLNFEYLLRDSNGFDLFAIYDSSNKLVYNFESSIDEPFTSPWIEGDTIYLRFANAIVALQEEESKYYEDVDKAFNDGATLCREVNSSKGKYECTFLSTSTPFPNFESKGLKVNSFDYQMAK